MGSEPSPLKYMGAQSPQTMNMAAAMAHTVAATERGDQVMRSVSRELTHAERHAADSRIADAAGWAANKAMDVLQSAARRLREQATRAATKPIRRDPVRAVLIAAAVGALLMSLLSMTARSGARAVERRMRR